MKQFLLASFLLIDLCIAAQAPTGTVHVTKNNIPSIDTVSLCFPGSDTLRFYYSDGEPGGDQFILVNGDTVYRSSSKTYFNLYAKCKPCTMQFIDPASGDILSEFESYPGCEVGRYVSFDSSGNIDCYGQYFSPHSKKINEKYCELKDGKWIYYTNKKIAREEFWKMGEKDSTWSYYNDNGTLVKTENYKAGKKDGMWSVYRSDGSLEHTETWINDEKNGDWKFYDKNGKLIRTQTWKKGKLVK